MHRCVLSNGFEDMFLRHSKTPPAPDSQHGLSTGSFELVTGGADSPEALSWPDQDPVDLFAAESNQDVAFQLDGIWEL